MLTKLSPECKIDQKERFESSCVAPNFVMAVLHEFKRHLFGDIASLCLSGVEWWCSWALRLIMNVWAIDRRSETAESMRKKGKKPDTENGTEQ